jgi:hypothetical protein
VQPEGTEGEPQVVVDAVGEAVVAQQLLHADVGADHELGRPSQVDPGILERAFQPAYGSIASRGTSTSSRSSWQRRPRSPTLGRAWAPVAMTAATARTIETS